MAGKGKTGELTRRWFSENCCDVTSGQASKIVLRFLPSIDDYRSEGCVSAHQGYHHEFRKNQVSMSFIKNTYNYCTRQDSRR